MTDQTPKRPWWRKRRWLAAGLLWLAVAYVAGFGIVVYLDGRGLVPPAWYPPLRAAYLPFFSGDEVRPFLRPYAYWWSELGSRHGRAASE